MVEPLGLVAVAGNLDMLRSLIDPEYASGDSMVPLHVACRSGHLEVVKFLIEEKGCDHT